ncbi:MAG: molecular chaperone DnaK [Candidatus Eremiobacteraeota bacterium]|nr:molecular chaperone DnaK [Candidatus Eremiobacteraeota bacterium]
MAAAVGIDLGTTFSAIARVDDSDRPVVIPNDAGLPVTASVVCFRDGEAIVGAEAKELQAAGHPAAAYFKRQMGQPAWIFCADGKDYSAVDLSALVLAKLKRDAERETGETIVDAVITVPAYFRNPQREATIEAGRRAGLNVVQVVNEPTAAAIAYGYRSTASGRLVLVYDLGGGTFDVTLLRVEPDEIRVLTSEGDHELGGKDWDDRVLEFLGQRFLEEFGVDPMDDRESLSDLLVRAEEAKRRLSVAASTRVSIVHGGHRGSYELDRGTFENFTADLLERTSALTRKVLAGQKLDVEALDGVLLVGGSTRMPMVHELVTRTFRRPPLTGVNVDEAVALGAALTAADRTQTPGAKSVFALGARRRTVDVTNHSLGMIAIGEHRTAYVNSVILPKNQEVPCVQSRPYQHRTGRRSAAPLEVFMTQGESDAPGDVTYLGKHVVTDVPPDPSGVTIVDIEYSYDASATVHVSARVRSSGQALAVCVEPLPPDVPQRFLGPPPEEAKPQHVTAYLAFDLSGSMSGAPLEAAKHAARAFLQNTDLAHCSLGIIGFSDTVEINLKACQNARRIEGAIEALAVGKTGFGNEADPFHELLRLMGKGDGPRFGVVLADGVWEDQRAAVKRAQACKERGIDVIAVGFGGADERFLKEIASSDEASFFTSLGGLVETFSTIAQVLTESGGGLVTAPAGTPNKGLLGFLSRG